MTLDAWHFVGATLRDGRPVPPDGKLLRWVGKHLVMCPTARDLEAGGGGLHASRRIIDALGYAPGGTICRVRCGGEMIEGDDKLVCRRRTILWRVNGENLLCEFARRQALSVAHLWDMPEAMRTYLETGDESLRTAARNAARDAAARDAAAGGAARVAAWVAAGGAARVAARDVAAGGAARVAAWVAAGGAARVAAWVAAGGAAGDAANQMLETMVMEARE